MTKDSLGSGKLKVRNILPKRDKGDFYKIIVEKKKTVRHYYTKSHFQKKIK